MKHCINLELLSVDLPYTCTIYALGQYKFKCFLYPAQLSYVSHSADICTVAIKNIRYMHAVSTNQTADILHIKDKELQVNNFSQTTAIHWNQSILIFTACKTSSKKINALFSSTEIFHNVIVICVQESTVIIGIVFLNITWFNKANFSKEYVTLFFQCFLVLLNPWLHVNLKNEIRNAS